MSAQNALQGSETDTRELLEGKKVISVSPGEGSLNCPPSKSMHFYQETEKIVFVATPGWLSELGVLPAYLEIPTPGDWV